ncbi:MAG TPA: Co2+/Mg2+ efflux protein ApaG [Pseudobdellovibrionaceae bacterium]|nr:Co2+/Mg2+ efflux protein ApaG [Pseudobdellovibrionaceae bacterium]
MSQEILIQEQFAVTAQVVYLAQESRPHEDYYFFAYKMRIQNSSNQTVQLLSRHWIIEDSLGRIEEVRGPGVVGLQPKIGPNQSFEYESACPLTTPSGSMRGVYLMLSESGENFSVSIPEFYLISPAALH